MPDNQNNENEQVKGEEANTVNDSNNKSVENEEKLGLAFYIIMIITFLMVSVAVGSSFLFFAVSRNYNNIAFKNRDLIEKLPIINRALPPIPDPDSVDNFNQRQLRSHYVSVLEERNALRTEKDALNEEFSKIKEEVLEFRENKEQFNEDKERLETEIERLEKDRDEFQKMVGQEEAEAFRKFFEEIKPEEAKVLYEKTVLKQLQNDLIQDLAEVYENMPVASSATILKELADQDMGLVVDIIRGMNKTVAGEIIAFISSDDVPFATKLSSKLAQ